MKLPKSFLSLTLLAIVILFSSCASIVSKSRYPLTISSTPTGANITVQNPMGFNIYSGTTPAFVRLKASQGYFSRAKYKITFEMDGYETKVVPIEFKLDAWYFGNVIFGGLIGILIVDPATGAMWHLNRDFVSETLSPKTENVNAEASLKVLDYSEIPDEWKENLVRVN